MKETKSKDMAALKLYPVGIQTFEDIINRNLLYVDKTEYIYRMTHGGGKYFFWFTTGTPFHQQTFQTIGRQLPNSQLSVCQNITAKKPDSLTVFQQFLVILIISVMDNFYSYRLT